jgi:hypothetical protein
MSGVTKHFAQSLCQDARKLDQICIYRLGASDDVGEGRSRDFVFLIADQYASLTIAQRLDGIDAQPSNHPGGHRSAPVRGCWCRAFVSAQLAIIEPRVAGSRRGGRIYREVAASTK